MANSVDPEQTAPIGAVCPGSTLFASILNLSVLLGNYLQQTTSADDIFRCIFFLGALRVNIEHNYIPKNFYLWIRNITVHSTSKCFYLVVLNTLLEPQIWSIMTISHFKSSLAAIYLLFFTLATLLINQSADKCEEQLWLQGG